MQNHGHGQLSDGADASRLHGDGALCARMSGPTSASCLKQTCKQNYSSYLVTTFLVKRRMSKLLEAASCAGRHVRSGSYADDAGVLAPPLWPFMLWLLQGGCRWTCC